MSIERIVARRLSPEALPQPQAVLISAIISQPILTPPLRTRLTLTARVAKSKEAVEEQLYNYIQLQYEIRSNK